MGFQSQYIRETLLPSADAATALAALGPTASAAEINVLDGVSAGTVTASKAVVVGANKEVDTLVIAASGLKIGSGAGTAVTATAAELNANAGVTAGTSTASKTLVLGTKKQTDFLQLGTATPTSTALCLGIGDSSNYEGSATANKNWIDVRASSTATSGDSRAAYIRLKFAGVGVSGEALRAYGDATAAGAVAAGGTVNGAHISLAVSASTTISGQGSAIRCTLDYATASRTMDANVSALLVDSNLGQNNTPHALNAFIRVANVGSVTLGKLFRLPTVASGGLLAAHTTDALSHSIRCVDDAGTVFYIMCTTDASNRTGGA